MVLCRCSLIQLVSLLEETGNLAWQKDLTLENVAAEIVRDLRQGLGKEAKVHVCLCMEDLQLLIRDAEAAGQQRVGEKVTTAVHEWMGGAVAGSSQCSLLRPRDHEISTSTNYAQVALQSHPHEHSWVALRYAVYLPCLRASSL